MEMIQNQINQNEIDKKHEDMLKNEVKYFEEMFKLHYVYGQNFITWFDIRNSHTYIAYEPFDPLRFYNLVMSQRMTAANVVCH